MNLTFEMKYLFFTMTAFQLLFVIYVINHNIFQPQESPSEVQFLTRDIIIESIQGDIVTILSKNAQVLNTTSQSKISLLTNTQVLSSSKAKNLPKNQTQTIILDEKHTMRLEGHRGAGHLEKENTLRAFQKAIELGLDGVEIDVWLTKDKIPVIVHGLFGGTVEFKNHKEKITQVNFKDLSSSKYILKNGAKVTSLARVLDLCKGKIDLNIEMKDPNPLVVEKVLTMVQNKQMLHQVTLSSFHHRLRSKLTQVVANRKLKSPVNFGFLMHVFKPIFPNYPQETIPGDFLVIDIRYLKKYRDECLAEIKRARQHSLKIKFWFPMQHKNEESFYEDLMNLKVDTVVTNTPLDIIAFAKTHW